MCSSHKKIFGFGDFILEGKISKLLLEGNLMASDKFIKKLNSIKSNPIAGTLYTAFSDKKFIDKDLSQNWIDVSDKEDTVSFIGDRSLGRIKDSDPSADAFSVRGRNEIKVGRLARAILTELGQKPSDKDIETFVNIYKASVEDKSKRFEIVTGVTIKKYYLDKNYSKNTGTLGGSCMKGEDCQKYFKIYTKNPESCRLLAYLDEGGKVLGRALVWKIYKSELYKKGSDDVIECPSEYFMDRVYTSNDSDIVKFVNYAKENGWLYKKSMNSDDTEGLIFKFGDEVIFGKLFVKLQRCHFRDYPFVDTLHFCDGDSLISNVGFVKSDNEDDDSDEQFMMNSTGGESEECSNCDNSGYDDDRGDECRKCDGDGDVNCPDCRGRGKEICKKCDGGGDIVCSECSGDGDYPCPTCNGNEDIDCDKCNGDGYTRCVVCSGKGDMGDCKSCDGDGDKSCPECKGESVVCKICKGEGSVVKAWGRGKRKVTCSACNGEGKGTRGDSKISGCRCGTCSSVEYGWSSSSKNWYNQGTITCKDCDGDGSIKCKACDGKEGYGSPGEIECEKCDGDGRQDCPNKSCRYGSIKCAKCKGDGNFGNCKSCDGDGTLGDCKNSECDDGMLECPVCSGSGKRPKDSKKPLCSECAGLLDNLKEDIKNGSFKI